MKISLQGYSESKLENPMGFEKAAPGPLYHKQEAFNVRNFEEARGYLKTIPFHDVEYLPVTCSHTFASVNIIDGEGRGIHKELCNEQGNIDKQKVLKLCPSWKKPLTEGIPCVVFRRELEEACPELPAFLSKAGNQTHDVHSKETKVQLMLTMNQLFAARKRLPESLPPAASAPPAASTSAASAPRVVEEASTSAASAPSAWKCCGRHKNHEASFRDVCGRSGCFCISMVRWRRITGSPRGGGFRQEPENSKGT